MTGFAYDDIRYEVEAPAAIVTIDRPDRFNAFRAKTVEECETRAAEAIEVHIAGLVADGEPVPEEAGKPQLLSVTVAA